jgi:tRNA A37 N6-isopentenylltransferase MiaA
MSQNKEKRDELESQAAEIQEQLTETVTEYKKVGNQMLIAGGIVAGSYLLYSMFSGSKKKGSFVGDAIKSYALALALSYAKDLLVDYLASLEEETEAAIVVEDSTANP